MRITHPIKEMLDLNLVTCVGEKIINDKRIVTYKVNTDLKIFLNDHPCMGYSDIIKFEEIYDEGDVFQEYKIYHIDESTLTDQTDFIRRIKRDRDGDLKYDIKR